MKKLLKIASYVTNNQVSGKFTFCQGGANSATMWNAILKTIKYNYVYYRQNFIKKTFLPIKNIKKEVNIVHLN